jgi:hypothetical protein
MSILACSAALVSSISDSGNMAESLSSVDVFRNYRSWSSYSDGGESVIGRVFSLRASLQRQEVCALPRHLKCYSFVINAHRTHPVPSDLQTRQAEPRYRSAGSAGETAGTTCEDFTDRRSRCASGAEAQAHDRRTEKSAIEEDEGSLGEAEEGRIAYDESSSLRRSSPTGQPHPGRSLGRRAFCDSLSLQGCSEALAGCFVIL